MNSRFIHIWLQHDDLSIMVSERQPAQFPDQGGAHGSPPDTTSSLWVCEVKHCRRTPLYLLIGTGKIAARKCGNRTLIMADSLRDYVANSPPASITCGQRKATA